MEKGRKGVGNAGVTQCGSNHDVVTSWMIFSGICGAYPSIVWVVVHKFQLLNIFSSSTSKVIIFSTTLQVEETVKGKAKLTLRSNK